MKKLIVILILCGFISLSSIGQYYEVDTTIKLNQNLVEKLIQNSEIYFCKMDTVFKSKDQIKLVKTVDLKTDYSVFEELYFEFEDSKISYLEIFTKSGKNCIYSREFLEDHIPLDLFENYIKNIAFETKFIDYDLSDIFEKYHLVYEQVDTARNGGEIVDFQKIILLKLNNKKFRSATLITKPNKVNNNDYEISSITLVSRDYRVFQLEGENLSIRNLNQIKGNLYLLLFLSDRFFFICKNTDNLTVFLQVISILLVDGCEIIKIILYIYEI